MSRTQQPKDSIARVASWTDQDVYAQDDGSILLWHVVYQTWVKVTLDEQSNIITIVRLGGESGVPPPESEPVPAEAEAVPAPPAEPTPEPPTEPATSPDVDEKGPEV